MQMTDRPATDIRKVLPGLFLALLLAMLDSTIVSTALPTISGDLGSFHLLSWVVVAYLLTSTVTSPLWGNLSDLFGRKQGKFLGVGERNRGTCVRLNGRAGQWPSVSRPAEPSGGRIVRPARR